MAFPDEIIIYMNILIIEEYEKFLKCSILYKVEPKFKI